MTALALIDAGGANLGSVRYALERLGVDASIVRDADELQGAQRVILPGVGSAAPAMALLRERGLDSALRALDVPLLGICLGMQLLFDASEEGEVECLGLLSGNVFKMRGDASLRVPHMGWNTLEKVRDSALLQDIEVPAHAYFVHGYAAPVTEDCIATSTYGEPFAACVQRGRVAGMQFHPERSADLGSTLLANFLCWSPA